MDLRDAAERIGVLHARALTSSRDLGAFGQQTEVARDEDLTGVAADGMHPLLEGVQLAGERGEGECAGDVRKLCGQQRVIEIQRADTRHGAGAVGDAEALLADERFQNGNGRLAHGLRAGETLTVEERFAASEQHKAHMRQRGQIAGRAQRALLRDHGRHAAIEHRDEHLHQQRPHTADANTERVCAEQHDPAHDLLRIRVAGAGAVAENEIRRELVAQLLRHGDGGKISEAGRDAVGDPLLRSDFFRQRAGGAHRLHGAGRDRDLCAAAADGDQLLQRQIMAGECNGMDGVGILHGFRSF